MTNGLSTNRSHIRHSTNQRPLHEIVHIENIEFAISINVNINGIIGKFGTVPMSSASQDHESAGQAQKDLVQAFQDLAKSVITLRVLPIHPCPKRLLIRLSSRVQRGTYCLSHGRPVDGLGEED